MSNVIQVPDPLRFRTALNAVRERAASVHATADDLRRAQHVLLRQLQAGHSTAASVALANRELPSVRQVRDFTGGDSAA